MASSQNGRDLLPNRIMPAAGQRAKLTLADTAAIRQRFHKADAARRSVAVGSTLEADIRPPHARQFLVRRLPNPSAISKAAAIRPTLDVPSTRYAALTYTTKDANCRRNPLVYPSLAGLLDRRGARRVLRLDFHQSRGWGCGPGNWRRSEGSLVSGRARKTGRCPRRLLQSASRGPGVAFADLCQERTRQSANPCPQCR